MNALFFVAAVTAGTTVEERLTRVEEKLDRLDRLLTAVFGEEFKRVEELRRTPGLLKAIRDVERRYGVQGIRESLVAVESDRIRDLQGKLLMVINRADPARLKEDASFRMVLVEVMSRMDTQKRLGGHLVTSISRRDPTLLASLLPDFFGHPGGTEVALSAACVAKGEEVAGVVRAQLPLLTEPRQIVMAYAALLAQGEEGALKELRGNLKAVNDGELLHGLALNLRQGGAPAAMWLYLELLKSERFCIMAAAEFSRLKGDKRRPDPMKVRSERMKLYEEYAKWLDENYSRIRFDEMRRRFTLEAPEAGDL